MTFSNRAVSIAALALAAGLVAETANAGGYAGNGCVASKQKALGKYTKSVAKAWDKYPSDMTARDAAIATALTKLDGSWTKAEAKAVSKNATCDEATSSSGSAATDVDNAIAALSTENFSAASGYVSAALKAYSKYIKAPSKDPGKANLTAALAAASTDYLTGANLAVTSGATALKDELFRKTTQAPDWPDAFTSISYTSGTNVIYGKDTWQPRCVKNTDYMFFAKRGTTNKVLMYYQGGGACWDNTTCNLAPTCSQTADAGDNPDLTTTGFADYNNPSNPFYGWNVVFVTYCTCDVHWGAKKTSYVGGDGYHFGRHNAAVAEKWAREHFVDPEAVFVTGSSAGSYGAIMNSYWLQRDLWPNSDFAVLGDGGVGVITQQFLDTSIGNWGADANLPTDLPGVSLPIQNLSMVELIDGLGQKFPNARYANYDSSYDGGGGSQTQFFQAMRHPANLASEGTKWWEPACEWNACMREFKAENAARSTKYHYFTGAGSRHTIFGSDKVYTETKSTDVDGNGVTFSDWVAAMIDDTAAWEDVDCNHLNGDCNLTNSCQGGATPGLVGCTADVDCGGGTCQNDPDTANSPYANNDTVTCGPTTCPCELPNAKCFGGTSEGSICTTDADCPGGNCSYVNCPTFTP